MDENNNNISGEYREPEGNRNPDSFSQPEEYRQTDNYGESGEYRDPGQYSGMGNYTRSEESGTGNGFGIASLILGIVSLVGLCFCLGPITGLLAIIFGIIHLARRPEKRSFGIAGIITGSMGVILSIIIFAILMFGITAVENSGSAPILEIYEELLEEQGINQGKDI